MEAPESGDSLGVHQLEDAAFAVRPLDVSGAGFPILQQLQQELPQVRCVTCNQTRPGVKTKFTSK